MGICDRKDNSGWYNENLGTELWLLLLTCFELGPLLIYRVLGSVSFLSSGSTLHPILAKSQCWCVDGESKFVLRIRHDNYYRIELPNTCPEENLKVEEFKTVLAKVLQYERTVCPFKRGFTVDLPEPPETPVRKRPWKPQQRSNTIEAHGVNARMEDSDVDEIESEGVARTNTTTQQPETADVDASTISSESLANGCGDDCGSEVKEDNSLAFKNMIEKKNEELDVFNNSTQLRPLRIGRTVTAPPQLTLRTSPSSNSTIDSSASLKPASGSSSLSSSAESFHSFHSPISPLAPSPPCSDPSSPSPQPRDKAEINASRTRSHKRDSSEITVTSDPTGFWDMKNGETSEDLYTLSSAPPDLVSDAASQSEENWSEAITPSPSAEVRQRKAPQRRQTHSPLPSQANLYSPSCRMPGHHLTTAILQKTCSLLLGPPIQLVALMLNIASKIAKGAYRGAAYGYGEAGQKIPCSWDFSDADDDSDQVLEEDDYGFSLRKLSAARNDMTKEGDKSWEID